MYRDSQRSPDSYPPTPNFPALETSQALGKSALATQLNHRTLCGYPDIRLVQATPTPQPAKRRNSGSPHYDTQPGKGGGGLVGARPKAISESGHGLYSYLTTESL
jgi:hypothetical protein